MTAKMIVFSCQLKYPPYLTGPIIYAKKVLQKDNPEIGMVTSKSSCWRGHCSPLSCGCGPRPCFGSRPGEVR